MRVEIIREREIVRGGDTERERERCEINNERNER